MIVSAADGGLVGQVGDEITLVVVDELAGVDDVEDS